MGAKNKKDNENYDLHCHEPIPRCSLNEKPEHVFGVDTMFSSAQRKESRSALP